MFLRLVEAARGVVVAGDGKRTKSESWFEKLLVVLVAGIGGRGEWG